VPEQQPFDLSRTYLSIDDDGVGTPINVTNTFWQELISGQRQVGRWLMGAAVTQESPKNWDLHPEGECILILLSGSIDVIIDAPDGEHVVQLRHAGDSCSVPRGTWHRQVVHASSNRIFITAGMATQMRPV
jgi:mannose-6-phosphate isomerase-like protein (cupin superfamily)